LLLGGDSTAASPPSAANQWDQPERIFRVHVNTLEWLPTFLIPLWLCAIYLSDVGAAVGVVMRLAGG
jgi:hypothetical protein